MFNKKLPTIDASLSEFKKFSYSNNETRKGKRKVNLNFELRVDIPNELRDFKLLLERALEDVTEEYERRHGDGD